MNFKQKLTTGMATGTLLAAVMSASAFATTVTVSGNGNFSGTVVNVNESSVNSVTQTNTTSVVNSVNTSAYTGGNSSSFNVGGNTSVVSGDVTNDVRVNNVVGSNQAAVTDCGCGGTDTVRVTGTGNFSFTSVGLTNSKVALYGQNNFTTLMNGVNTGGNTGGNSASFNVRGTKTVRSGAVTNTVRLNNRIGSNWLMVNP